MGFITGLRRNKEGNSGASYQAVRAILLLPGRT